MSDDNNDDPKHNRKDVPTSSPSPMGTIRKKAKREVTVTVFNEESPASETRVDLSRNDINYEPTINGFKVLLRIEDAPFADGLEKGRISRLTLVKGDLGSEDIFAHFDNGEWIKDAKTPLEIQTVMTAKAQHNGLTQSYVTSEANDNQKPKMKP
ncbi:MAG: hypothetical protein AAGJ35_09605 [Myxococcota bacterium]